MKKSVFILFIDHEFPRYINNLQTFEYDTNKDSIKLAHFKDSVPDHLQNEVKFLSLDIKDLHCLDIKDLNPFEVEKAIKKERKICLHELID